MTQLVDGLLTFLSEATTPYHAVDAMEWRLKSEGFIKLDRVDGAVLEPGCGYYVTRNDSSVIAFTVGSEAPTEGVRIIGAHTDSPNLSVKPNPVKIRHGMIQLGVDVYGGALLNPWFDRDLSMAGRVSFVAGDGPVQSELIDFKKPVAIIPSLAIHLDREANTSKAVNAQRDILPILQTAEEGAQFDFRVFLAARLQEEFPEYADVRVLDYEISLYDTQAPSLVGVAEEFIASARLDNLLSCYVGLQSLLGADRKHWNILVCNDHEEVGSASAVGAQGPMLMDVLEGLAGSPVDARHMREKSLMISVDNAHAIHPNFSDKHDENHGPKLNAGPVIKINRNQRYATSGEGSAIIRLIAERANVPVQAFVVRTDLGCGSTIGPITAAETGIPTIDIGVPTFAMHSIRELAGAADPDHLKSLLVGFLNRLA